MENSKPKLAILGSGITGLVCAYKLQNDFDVKVFEANDYIGGHTHTVDVEWQGDHQRVDTGFIVFNTWTYPNFIQLIDELKVPWKDTSMSFSVKCEKTGLEYNGTSLSGIFSQTKNIFRLGILGHAKRDRRLRRQSQKVDSDPRHHQCGRVPH